MAGYGDDSGFSAWLNDNGYTLPDGAPSPAVLRNRGSELIDATYGTRFSGLPTGGYAQERAWPRTGATSYGAAIPGDVVPNAVIQASYYAAFQAVGSTGSLVISQPKPVKRRKVGDVEVEFEDGGSSATFVSSMDIPATLLDGLLAAFLIVPETIFIRSVGC